MGSQSSKSSLKNNNRSKQINFVDNAHQSKYSGMKSGDRQNDVLTKFVWNYGGNSVYLTGSFNNWKKNIPMQKQSDQFSITLLLPRQIHQYKFIVDGEWRFSPQDLTMSDDNGYINNYIDTTNFQPLIPGNTQTTYIDDLSGPIYRKASKSKSKNKDKKQQYAKYAPKLPPHYQYCTYLVANKKQQNILGNIDTTNNLRSSNQIHLNIMPTSKYSPYSPYINLNINNLTSPSPYQLDRSPLFKPKPSQKPQPQTTNNKLFHIQQQGDQNYQASLTKQQVQYLFNTPHSLPMPTHSVLDHVMLQKGQWYSAMAVTQRFKQKYTTFIHYTMYSEDNTSMTNINLNTNTSTNSNTNDNNSTVDKNKGRNINNPQNIINKDKIQLNLNLNQHYMQTHGQQHQQHIVHSKDYVDPKLNHLNSSNI